ncbi:MAG: hypothetical protein IT499_24020 [Rubrivivax sp.]|nr:hypothetical protein [Rubrivivax sp.]
MDDKLNQNNATPTPDLAEQARLQRERRRRFIRLGAGSVPVGLTLTSRPVMAWHCYTTSAWGSQRADGVAAGTSVYNRLERNVGTTRINNDECWYITNWQNNSGRTGGPARYQKQPWMFVGDQLRSRSKPGGGSYSNYEQSEYAKNTLTVAAVFPNGLVGCAGSTKCWSLISNGVSSLADYLLIAGLNRKYAETFHQQVMNQCLNPTSYTGPDQLDQMAKLGTAYKPPGRSVAWDAADIKTYLSASYLAV